jgi:hypothetical protein
MKNRITPSKQEQKALRAFGRKMPRWVCKPSTIIFLKIIQFKNRDSGRLPDNALRLYYLRDICLGARLSFSGLNQGEAFEEISPSGLDVFKTRRVGIV